MFAVGLVGDGSLKDKYKDWPLEHAPSVIVLTRSGYLIRLIRELVTFTGGGPLHIILEDAGQRYLPANG